jgi:phage terminase large subunit-like protein
MMQAIHALSREQANEMYADVITAKDAVALRHLCQHDLFFLLTIGCRRQDMNRDWLYQRCREVEAEPNGFCDLWAREHYKSTIITYGKTIQDILCNPDITVGIFSHTRPIAKAFLKQIKLEFEGNQFLKGLFPDVLYLNPEREAPSWSLDNGITVKRKTNPKENTIEAWGLVDGQPTSKHYSLLVYDDTVTLESVSTPEMILKTTDAWAMSLNLGAHGGAVRTIGTYYHAADSYREMEKRGSVKVRKHPATKDGTRTGEPVFLTREAFARKWSDMGSYVAACQLLLDPVADNAQGFKKEWLNYYDGEIDLLGQNIYILVDPANAKKKANDFTVMQVVGLGEDGNYYLLKGVRDRLNLTERTRLLFSLVRQYRPLMVGYESYGIQADVQHVKYVQGTENYRFPIKELGGPMPKDDRIRRLVPVYENSRFYLPRRSLYRDYQGQLRDFVAEFTADEFLSFPVAAHDDMLDCQARILDPELGAVFPAVGEASIRRRRQSDAQKYGTRETPRFTNSKYAVLP